MREELVNGSHLQNLPVMMVRYAPRNLETVAIPVTIETIGAMAIEFGVEIERTNMGPVIVVSLERKGDIELDRQAGPGFLKRRLYLSEWLVELDGEIHIFPQDVMWNTFSQATDPAHQRDFPKEIDESFNAVAMPSSDAPAGPATGFLNLPVELTADRKLPDLPA